MPQFYLSRYIGTGTFLDPYQPAVQMAGWSAIDLRGDPTSQAGFCLVSTSSAVASPPVGTINLGTGGVLSAALRNQLNNALGVTLSGGTVAATVRELLMDRAGGSRWKALQAARVGGRYRWEIHLGGLLWSQELPIIGGGAAVSDDFDRADNTNLGANWTEDNRDWQIISNAVKPVAPAADAILRYTGASMDTNDQYVEASVTTAGGWFAGVITRHPASSTATYYGVGVESTNSRQIFKSISGAVTVLKNIAGTISFPGTVRQEVQGSTIRGLWNGVGFASATDTSITSGPHVGMFSYDPSTYYSWSAGDLAPLDYSGQPLLTLPQPLAERQVAFTPYQPPITLRTWAGADDTAGGAIDLVVDDAAQAQSTDAIALTQVHILTVADAAQPQTADSITLTQVHNLTVQDATQTQTVDSPTLTQVHNLAVADGLQAQIADNVALTQVHSLVVADAVQAQTVDNVTVAVVSHLVVQDALQSQTVDNVALTQAHQLAVQDALQAQSTDAVALTQAHQLAAQDAAQAHSADSVTLTQVHNLTVADAEHGQSADNVVIVVGGITLVVEDAAQAHSADAVTLTQVHNLAVADAAHAQTADAVALTQAHSLVVADAAQAQTTDVVALLQAHNLTVQDATQAQSVDSIALAQTHVLAVQDATHGHTADAVTLTQAHILAVQDALHAQAVDQVTLTQTHVLTVADALQTQAVDNVVLTIGGPLRDITVTAVLGDRRLAAGLGARRATVTAGTRRLTLTGG